MTNFNRDGSRTVWTVFVIATCVVLALRMQAHAAQWEIGAGIARAQTRGNGTWYQDGFPHTLRLNQPAALIGLTGRFTQHLDWHLDAVSLGQYSSNSQDVLPDANYSPTSPTHCNGPCNPLAHYMGIGRVWGIQALLGAHTTGAYQFGVEAGPFFYRESWNLSVPNWYTQGIHYDIQTRQAQWAIGAIGALTLTHGAWTVALARYQDGAGFPGHTGPWPPLWRNQTALIVTYRFGDHL